MKLSLARRGKDGAPARNLFEAYPFINAVQIPLGNERGFIKVWEDGDVDFHLEHTPDEEVYPGFQDEDGIRFNALDAPIFRFILEVLESAREIVDEQAEALKNARGDEEPAGPIDEKKPVIVAGAASNDSLNRFCLK
jgi:hypothetical protein